MPSDILDNGHYLLKTGYNCYNSSVINFLVISVLVHYHIRSGNVLELQYLCLELSVCSQIFTNFCQPANQISK